MSDQGHPTECCEPDECAWCCLPIEAGEPWARKTTTVHAADGTALKQFWSDYHHNPATYEARRDSDGSYADWSTEELGGRVAAMRAVGSCLWHSEQGAR